MDAPTLPVRIFLLKTHDVLRTVCWIVRVDGSFLGP